MSERNFTKYFVKALTFCFLILTLSFVSPHKFFTSITSIEHNSKQKSAEIIMNVFIDDLEMSLSAFHKTKIKIDEKTIKDKNLENQLSQYLSKHFIISKNKKAYQNKLIGIDYNKKDMVSIYIEIEQLKILNSLSILNTMLFKEFDEQVNIINIKEGNKKQTLVFNKSTQELAVNLN